MNIRQAVALQDVESLQNLLHEDSNLLRLSKRHSLAWKAFSLLMRNKLYGDADKIAEILLLSNSDNIQLYICRLKALRSKANLSEFESLLRRALRFKPDSYSLLWIGARGLQMMGRYELALQYARKCMSKKKANSKVCTAVLETQLACGVFEDSDDIFLRAFRMVESQVTNKISSTKRKSNLESKLLTAKRGIQKLKFQHLSAHRILEARSLWRDRSIPKSYRCDVICIASDEAPYLHEFVHHYLFLGFSNIFIGINNSSDKTYDFALQLAAADPRIHVISTDDVHVELTQRSSYSKLYHYAASVTHSSYCLFVDVDEFWVAQPFPMKVESYLESFKGFDCLSCNWVNCFHEDQFSAPLSRGLDFRLKSSVKSFVAYQSDLVELRCHAPVFRQSSARVIDAVGNPQDLNLTEIGFEAPGAIVPSEKQFYSKSHTSVVLHRHNRSVLEYSYRMFKPHANQVKYIGGKSDPIPFKENRPGCNKITGISISTDFIDTILPVDMKSDYHQSLDNFIQGSGAAHEIEKARLQISDQEIKRRISELDQSTLLRCRSVWEKGFSGTPYLELLQDRCDQSYGMK